jgi:hypothetical protein
MGHPSEEAALRAALAEADALRAQVEQLAGDARAVQEDYADARAEAEAEALRALLREARGWLAGPFSENEWFTELRARIDTALAEGPQPEAPAALEWRGSRLTDSFVEVEIDAHTRIVAIDTSEDGRDTETQIQVWRPTLDAAKAEATRIATAAGLLGSAAGGKP